MLALLGQAQHQVNRLTFSGALKTLNQTILSYQEFLPPFLDKMKVQIALQEWEQAVETAQRWAWACIKHFTFSLFLSTVHLVHDVLELWVT